VPGADRRISYAVSMPPIFGHDNIQHGHLRIFFLNALKSYLAIFGFVDFPMRFFGQQRAKSAPDKRLVVSNQNFSQWKHVALRQRRGGGQRPGGAIV